MEAELQDSQQCERLIRATQLASEPGDPMRILHCSYLTNEFECTLNATSLLAFQKQSHVAGRMIVDA
jgi:hypothetical protein